MVQLFLRCPRMNLLRFTLTTWKVERHSVLRTKAVNGYHYSLLIDVEPKKYDDGHSCARLPIPRKALV